MHSTLIYIIFTLFLHDFDNSHGPSGARENDIDEVLFRKPINLAKYLER